MKLPTRKINNIFLTSLSKEDYAKQKEEQQLKLAEEIR